MATERKIESYQEFWPFYLGEHSRSLTRLFHVFGTGSGLLLLVIAIITQTWWLLAVAAVCGYAFAWLSHWVIERNQPATFTYPWWSFVSDFKMLLYFCTGRLEGELRRFNIASA